MAIKVLKGNTIAVETSTPNRKSKSYIKRLKGNRYVVLSTGEIRGFSRSDISMQKRNLRRKMKNFILKVDSNFKKETSLFVTLTCEKKDFEYTSFLKKLSFFQRKLKKINSTGYVRVVEQHKDGSYHAHYIIRTSSRKFIPNQLIAQIWSYGFTKTERPLHVNSLAFYIGKYVVKGGVHTQFSKRLAPVSESTFEDLVNGGFWLYKKVKKTYISKDDNKNVSVLEKWYSNRTRPKNFRPLTIEYLTILENNEKKFLKIVDNLLVV